MLADIPDDDEPEAMEAILDCSVSHHSLPVHHLRLDTSKG